MDIGEWLTRGTIWLALILYVVGEVVAGARRADRWAEWGRWAGRLGFVAFVGHTASAFHFHHQWSHAAAYGDTARQTAELFGWDWGGGLYANYVFGLVWLGEVGWDWLSPRSRRRRAGWITGTVRGFFFVMIFSGAAVFTEGAVRWFGVGLSLALGWSWWGRKPGGDTSNPGH